jgi:hypothetical protein
MSRRYPMPDYYVRAAIVAELGRAARAGRPIDRQYLQDETGVAWWQLDKMIAAIRKQRDSVVRKLTAEGGAIGKPIDQGPNGPDPDPFASPTPKGKARL